MNLALAIVLTWTGCALLWVAFHGIDAQDASPKGVLATIAGHMEVGNIVPAGGWSKNFG